MTQFYSRNDVNYSGDVYSIPFDYIDKKEVKVYIDDELWTEWHFLNKHQLTLDEVPAEIGYNNIISVRRETDIEEKVVTYDNNSLLNKENLNKSQDQLLFAVQEIYDNNVQFQSDIREEVDEKVERVSDAVEKLEFLEDSVAIANEAALEATEQAQIATEKAEETLNTYNEAMAEIDTLRQNSIEDIDQLVADHTNDLNSLDATIKKDADAIINRVGFNMFDAVVKDHILTYEESKGLALQGTYVYKEAIAGSRYGYPDFYNQCLEEYENATEEMPFIQPINPNGISSTSGFSNASNAFDGNSSTYASCGTTTDYIEWDLGKSLTITGFNAKTLYASGAARACNVAIYSVDVNGVETLLANGSGVPAGSPGTCSATFSATKVTKLRFKVLAADGGEAPTTQFPSRVAEINITATDPKFRKNPNGHMFYDISDKEQIDEVFASTGMAWMYGIDQENERVFLPRNKYFATTGEVVGNGMTLGWTDGTNNAGTWGGTANDTINTSITNYGASVGTQPVSGKIGNSVIGITTDPTKSGIVLNPDENKHLYICVGNTNVESAVTDVVDVTTTENDTTPLFTGMYFDFKPNNVSWLKAGQQSSSGGIYKTCYNELVNVLNGETKYGSLKVVDFSKMVSGTDYSLYWKVNQTNQTFIAPTAYGLVSDLQGNRRVLVDKKEPTDTDPTWYNWYSDGWCEQGGRVNSVAYNSAVKNVTFLIPMKDSNYYATAVPLTSGTNDGSWNISARVAGLTTTQMTVRGGINNNEIYTGMCNWEISGYAEIPAISDYTENVNLYFKVANAVQNLELLNVGEVMEAVNGIMETVNETLKKAVLKTENISYITETYVNGTSWYRVWSDGFCMQGIKVSDSSNGNTGRVIKFLKPFKDTNYVAVVTGQHDAKTGAGWDFVYSLSTTGCKVCSAGYSSHVIVCGYIA